MDRIGEDGRERRGRRASTSSISRERSVREGAAGRGLWRRGAAETGLAPRVSKQLVVIIGANREFLK